MQKKFQVALLLVAVVTLIWAVPVLASEIIMTTRDEITFTITPWGTAPPGSLSATAEVSVYGHAEYNPHDYANDYQSSAVPGNSSVSPTPTTGAWLKTNISSADSTSSPIQLSTQMKGWGPQPSDPLSGFIHQNSSSYYGWEFTAPDTAPANSLYFVVVTNNFTDHFQLKQEAGSPYPLYRLYGYTYHNAWANWPKGYGDAYVYPTYYDNSTYPNPLSNFDQSVSDQLVFGVLLQLNPGETAYGGFQSAGYYDGYTTVPIPASALLLGSGLLGLGLVGFRMRKRT